MRFVLLVLVNGCVFIRPGEIIPWLDEMPVFAGVSLTILAIAYSIFLARFAPSRLQTRPIRVGALALLAAIVFSCVTNAAIVESWTNRAGFTAIFHDDPWLEKMPVYEFLFLISLALSYPSLLAELKPKRLVARPINACALGMLVAIVASHLANGETPEAWASGSEFSKVFLYYVLLVAVVDTPKRLEQFLTSVALFASVITTMAVLHYHKIIHVQSIQFLQTSLDDSGDADSMIRRLGSTGVFADPNDMCLMLVLAMTVCVYQILEKQRYYWAVPLALFGHALMMTHSRGGFLAMLGALVTLMLARYGRKALLPGLLVLPAVFVVFAGSTDEYQRQQPNGPLAAGALVGGDGSVCPSADLRHR